MRLGGACFFRLVLGTKGEIVGYNTVNGTNYGGSDEPLPPGARAVFAIFKDGWQTVPATKGKRAHGS